MAGDIKIVYKKCLEMTKSRVSNNHNNKFIRSFGRIKSRKLSQSKNDIFDKYYEKYQFDIKKLADLIVKNKPTKINLEIGFGDGDFLYNLAKNNSSEIFIGCEPYLNGMINLLTNLKKDLPENILVYNGDFRNLSALIKDNFGKIFDRIFILFPDPWPKSKHYKRRLISKDFLDQIIIDILKNSGELLVATDHDILKTWILSSLINSNKFSWHAQKKEDWLHFPQYWIETKYQKKAAQENRQSIIIKAIANDGG